MNFKEYLQFVEAMTMSAEDLNYNKRYDSLIVCSFKHDGNDYEVKFGKSVWQGVPDVWGVVFSGPAGTRTTGTTGTASSMVYNKLLSCIKKLFENETVNGINFRPAEEGMAIPYDLFYRNFLRPNPPKGAGFLMVSPELYLSKDKVREMAYTGNLLAANRMQMAKIELIKIDKAMGRIFDRINRGKAFATDQKTLDDLEQKKSEIYSKYQQLEREYQLSTIKTQNRREEARRRAEEEAQRISAERERERLRIHDEKMQKIRTMIDKTLVRRGDLPPDELVLAGYMEKLKVAPWVALVQGNDDEHFDVVFGEDLTSGNRISTETGSYFDLSDYIIQHFVEMPAGDKQKLARRIYAKLLRLKNKTNERQINYMVSKLPLDLRGELSDLGPFARGVERLKKKAGELGEIPMQTYRYWSGKPNPEDEENDLDRWDTL